MAGGGEQCWLMISVANSVVWVARSELTVLKLRAVDPVAQPKLAPVVVAAAEHAPVGREREVVAVPCAQRDDLEAKK